MSGHKLQQYPDYTGIGLQTSSMSLPCPLGWGQFRGAPNLIDYVGFKVHKQQVGKGAALGKQTEYTYSATILEALCEGPIVDVSKTYVNQGSVNGFSSKGFVLFKGTTPQIPWSFMTTNFPSHARGYQGICYMAAANFNLGASESVPATNFEIKGVLYNTAVGATTPDADPALMVDDFLTNDQYGAFFPAARIDTASLYSSGLAPTTGDSAYQTYCQAMGFGLSPFIASQEAAIDILARWLQITNSTAVWTGYSLTFVPYGDATVTANGVTYLPPTASQFNLGDDDWVQDADNDPVQQTVSDWFDAYNAVSIECLIRANEYNAVPIDWIDDSAVDAIGRRPASMIQAHEICDPVMGTTVVSLIGQRLVNIRNGYKATLDPRYTGLLPMACGFITDTDAGIINLSVRILDIEEKDNGDLDVLFEEFPGTTGQPADYVAGAGSATINNSQVVPDPVNVPIIFEPNADLAAFLNGGSRAPIIAALASGGSGGVADPHWGGAVPNVSTDGTTYAPLSPQITQAARQGTLTGNLAAYGGSNPDNVNTLSVTLAESAGILQSASSSADAAAGATLCWVDGELIGFTTATLTGTNTYDLTGLYRGLFGSTPGSHTAGALFGRLDNATFIGALQPDYITVPLDFKFQSFNVFNQQLQDVSTCTAYPYTPTGTGYGGGTGGIPTTPAALSAVGQIAQNYISWSPNPGTDNVTAYQVWGTAGPSGSFGSAILLWTGLATNWTETGLGTLVDRTYFIVAVNVIGSSSPTGGEDATTSSTAVAGKQQYGYVPSVFDISQCAGKTIRISIGVSDWTFPATTSTPAGYVTGEVATAPASQTDFDIQKDGVSIGTARWAAASKTPTLIKASDTAFVSTDYLDVIVPANLNGMAGAWSLSLMGTRP